MQSIFFILLFKVKIVFQSTSFFTTRPRMHSPSPWPAIRIQPHSLTNTVHCLPAPETPWQAEPCLPTIWTFTETCLMCIFHLAVKKNRLELFGEYVVREWSRFFLLKIFFLLFLINHTVITEKKPFLAFLLGVKFVLNPMLVFSSFSQRFSYFWQFIIQSVGLAGYPHADFTLSS